MRILFQDIDILTGDLAAPLIRRGEVLVTDGVIARVGKAESAEPAPDRVISGKGRILMPGLINAHAHVPMAVLRSYADDMVLQEWLDEHILPAEDRWDNDCISIAAQLGLAEMIASGTTSCSDMYFFCDPIAQAVAVSGMKANLSRSIVHFDDSPVDRTERWAEMCALVDQWNGYDHGRIRTEAALHAIYSTTSASRIAVGEYAAKHGIGLVIHLSETKKEVEDSLARYGVRPAQQLDKEGILTDQTTAAHCVWLDEAEMELLAARGVSAAHCPVSNLKLASGIAPVAAMRRAGVNVALGTDGAASNNTQDMLAEMKQAALLAKGTSLNPKLLSAAEVFAMATVNGARAQGRTDCGRIAPGMEADLVLLDADAPNLYPNHNALSATVYAAHGGNVCMTMVRGNILYENGEFQTLDREKLDWGYRHVVLPRMFGVPAAED